MFVYAALAPDGLVKIGYTRDALRYRMAALRCKLIGYEQCESGRAAQLRERELHKRFAEHRKHGEYFAITQAQVVEEIMGGALP